MTHESSAGVTVMASIVSERLVPVAYWPTKPSDWSQPASAASAIGATSATASRSETVRCHSSESPGSSVAASTHRPPPSYVLFQTMWSGVRSSRCPALVCRRMTSRTPLALVATIVVSPWASKILVPTASLSTSSPMGIKPAGVVTKVS